MLIARNGWIAHLDRGPAHGMGFGLGAQIVEDPVAADLRVSKDAWGWAGAYGTNVHIERAEHMVQIIMLQTSTPSLQRDFENDGPRRSSNNACARSFVGRFVRNWNYRPSVEQSLTTKRTVCWFVPS